MKKIIRHYAVNTFSLWATSQVASGIIFGQGTKTLLIAGAGLMVASLFAKPVINLLLLPLNLISFGLFRWVSSAIMLYLVTLVIKEFKIMEFSYPGLVNKWMDIPALHIEGALAIIAFSFILSIFTSVIYWIIK